MPLQLLFSNWLWKKNSFPWPLRKEDRTCLHGPRLSKPTGGDGATHKCPSQAAWWRGITISLVILFTQGASFAWTGFDSLIFPTDCMSYLKKKKKSVFSSFSYLFTSFFLKMLIFIAKVWIKNIHKPSLGSIIEHISQVSVLVFLGGWDKMPQTGWPEQWKFISSWLWRLEV